MLECVQSSIDVPEIVVHITKIGQMPALKMKTKSSTGCLREGNGLHICRKSKISKKPCSNVRISQQTEESDTFQNCQEVSSSIEVSVQEIGSGEAVDHQELLDEDNLQFQSSLVDSASIGRMAFLPATCPSNLETIFSPILESNELLTEPNIQSHGVGSDDDADVPHLTVDDSDDGSSSSCDYLSCNVSDFYISDISVTGFPLNGNTGFDDTIDTNPYPFLDYDCAELNMMFDMADKYMILPFLEETVETSTTHIAKSCEEAMMNSDDSCLYFAIHQMKSCNQEPDVNPLSVDSNEADWFDPHLFIRNLPLSDVVPNFPPVLLPKETRKRKSITVVLDLDETLVHSTLERCDDADFTFPVFFNMKEHTVYVRQRPYLQTFLERVSEMFEIFVFTASQSTYAEQLVNILDPDRKLISQRAYRESCIFSDGSYTKDLTVLGVDLAKVFIIDNTPQVFRLQVNNGIPIKSWFDDPSDRALISLLPFLETLVDVDDVRPIIAKRFNNKE
ncbi:hypothetical protein HHK36_001609 [Tetracentron sinense]|uniref:FCP1 homology domain-containing protein n=1 Tax=Tetracentron sinense TaxID=13715 RepID=A0A835A3Z9_TETSI|nr:hypothetical protein HHK36_001609 [Tetracentron sinense]